MRLINAGFICAQEVSHAPNTAEILIGLRAQTKLQKSPQKRENFLYPSIFFPPYNLLRLPILQAPWLLAWTHLTPCLPVFRFKSCRYYFQLLPELNISILFPTSVKHSILSGFDLYIFSWKIFYPNRSAGAEITWHCWHWCSALYLTNSSVMIISISMKSLWKSPLTLIKTSCRFCGPWYNYYN